MSLVIGKPEDFLAKWKKDGVFVTAGTAAMRAWRRNGAALEYLQNDLSSWGPVNDIDLAVSADGEGFVKTFSFPASALGFYLTFEARHSDSDLPPLPLGSGYVDEEVASRAKPGDAMALTAGERSAIQAELEEDGASILDTLRDRPAPLAAATDQAEHDATQAAIGALPSAPSVAAIADGVWDEALAGHLAVGSTGEALDDADATADPAAVAAAVWAAATRTLTSVAAVMDAQGYTTARAALLDQLDAAVSSRESEASAASRAATDQAEHDTTQLAIAGSTAGLALEATSQSTLIAVARVIDDLENRLVVNLTNSRLELYDDAGATIIRSWPLKDKDGNAITATTPVFERGVLL